MGLFNELAQAVLRGFGDQSSPQGKLAQGLLDHLQTNGGGGLSSLADMFSAKGLGSVVQSWIGTGANQPITPQQLEGAVGSDWITQLAEKAGLPPDAAGHMSTIA